MSVTEDELKVAAAIHWGTLKRIHNSIVTEQYFTAEGDIIGQVSYPLYGTQDVVEAPEVEETWLDRLKQERADLYLKICKLEAVEFQKLPFCDQTDLRAQLLVMRNYLAILEHRLRRAGG